MVFIVFQCKSKEHHVNIYSYHCLSMERSRTHCKHVWFFFFYCKTMKTTYVCNAFLIFTFKGNENHTHTQCFLYIFIVKQWTPIHVRKMFYVFEVLDTFGLILRSMIRKSMKHSTNWIVRSSQKCPEHQA